MMKLMILKVSFACLYNADNVSTDITFYFINREVASSCLFSTFIVMWPIISQTIQTFSIHYNLSFNWKLWHMGCLFYYTDVEIKIEPSDEHYNDGGWC